MPLQIIRNDISKVKADAIVNTANAEVAVGAGVDEAIYNAAGREKLLAERAKIGHLDPGQAAVTPAFGLDAKYIIHTVGPAWIDGKHGEKEAVASCYRESLRIAKEKECESVAFPLISTGTFGFPKDKALKIAINEISTFLFENEMTVYMVVYDKESFVLSGKAFQGVRTYIEEKDVRPRMMNSVAAGGMPSSARRERRKIQKEINVEENYIMESAKISKERSDLLHHFGPITPEIEWFDDTLGRAAGSKVETFQELLFRHIDRKGLTDPEVYKRANMDRKLFSKIRSNKEYIPSKKNILALAVSLRLNIYETVDLLQRAGYALSPSIEFDRIVAYCIQKRIYDIFELNTYLFKYTEQILA